jgi:hypothetical protein
MYRGEKSVVMNGNRSAPGAAYVATKSGIVADGWLSTFRRPAIIWIPIRGCAKYILTGFAFFRIVKKSRSITQCFRGSCQKSAHMYVNTEDSK